MARMPLLVAIVGSVDPARSYDPPLGDVDQARTACEEIGRELALAGCRIAVYSNRARFVEASAVRGYVASGAARERSIEVHTPHGADTAEFDDTATRSELFAWMPDPSRDWEVSFYQSLLGLQGLILIGGGRSTLIAGVMALSMGLPVLPVAALGGASARVWAYLAAAGRHATEQEAHTMASAWQSDSASKLVTILLNQHRRRLQSQNEQQAGQRSVVRRRCLSALLAGLLVLLAGAAIPLAQLPQIGPAGAISLLTFAPLVAGTAGALIRTINDSERSRTEAAVLGLAAGFVSVLLYVASQVAAIPDALKEDGIRRLLFFVLPIGFVAGFTFDVVYNRLKTADVADVSVVEAPRSQP